MKDNTPGAAFVDVMRCVNYSMLPPRSPEGVKNAIDCQR